MSEWTDEVSPIGTGREPTQRAGRRSFTETISIGANGSSEAKAGDPGDREVETIKLGARAGRQFSDNARRMLDNIDKHGTVDDAAPSAETPTAEVVSPPAAAVPAVAVPAPTVTPVGAAPAAAAVAPIPDPAAEHRERAERLTEHNRKLLSELETLKAAPRHREPTAREKALDEAERSYIEDPVASIRRLVATAIGSDDPKSKEVDSELTGLYQDLTERELGVALDPSQKFNRETARTRRLRERDKRDLRAEQEAAAKPADDSEARQADAAHASIGRDLTAREHSKTYPLLMGLATELHGMPPEALIWREIRAGVASGEFDSKAGDQQLIDAASKKIETQYQALADRIGKARPTAASSTATPQTQASPATESKADPQGTGVRTITNASASVAPATPPAKKPEPTAPTEQPKYRNEKERRQALAAKHFG